MQAMKVKRSVAVSESGFLFNPGTGDSYSINPIGQEIFKMLQDGDTKEDIKKHILDTYMVDDATFEKDFYDFVVMLKNYKLIEQEDDA